MWQEGCVLVHYCTQPCPCTTVCGQAYGTVERCGVWKGFHAFGESLKPSPDLLHMETTIPLLEAGFFMVLKQGECVLVLKRLCCAKNSGMSFHRYH